MTTNENKSTKAELSHLKLLTLFGKDYDDIFPPQSGVAIVIKDELYGIINLKGEVIVPLEFNYISDFRNKMAVVESEYNYFGLVDIAGKFKAHIVYDSIETAWRGGLKAPAFRCGLLKVEFNGKFGFLDKNGKTQIQPIYEHVDNFNNQGIAKAKKDNKWGMINTMGETTLDFNYDEIFFENRKIGYIVVGIGDIVEVIDYSGKILSNDELEKMHEKNK